MPGRSNKSRRAATTLEFAVVLPVFLLFLWGIFEFGRVLMAEHALQRAAVEAARVAVLPDASTEDALAAAEQVLAANGITNASIQFDPPDITDAAPGKSIVVRVTTSASNVRWLPFAILARDLTLRGEARMIKEGQVAFYRPPKPTGEASEPLPPPPDSQLGNQSGNGQNDSKKTKDKDNDKSQGKDNGKNDDKYKNIENDKDKDKHPDKDKDKNKHKDKDKDKDKDKSKDKDKHDEKNKGADDNKNKDKAKDKDNNKDKASDKGKDTGKSKGKGSNKDKGSGSWTFTDSALP